MKERKCSVDGCDSKHYQLGFCVRHYGQFRRHGIILKRTRYDPNEVISVKNHYEVVVYTKSKKKYEFIPAVRFKIDKTDLEKVKKYKWSIHDKSVKTPYIETQIKKEKKRISLRALLVKGYDSGNIKIMFKNGNRLDFRKKNIIVRKK